MNESVGAVSEFGNHRHLYECMEQLTAVDGTGTGRGGVEGRLCVSHVAALDYCI